MDNKKDPLYVKTEHLEAMNALMDVFKRYNIYLYCHSEMGLKINIGNPDDSANWYSPWHDQFSPEHTEVLPETPERIAWREDLQSRGEYKGG
jgi:hypothetical protein